MKLVNVKNLSSNSVLSRHAAHQNVDRKEQKASATGSIMALNDMIEKQHNVITTAVIEFKLAHLNSRKPSDVTAARLTSSLTSLTATWSRRRMAALLAVSQYAMAIVNMPERRRMGSLSRHRLSMSVSASSSRPNIVSAMPSARPRKIFSCCVSCAYCNPTTQHV